MGCRARWQRKIGCQEAAVGGWRAKAVPLWGGGARKQVSAGRRPKVLQKSSAERAVMERDLMQWREAVAHGSAGAVAVRPVGVRILVKNALPTEKP